MRYLKSYTIVSFLFLILIGQTYSVVGQTSPIADHVVINEVETNPPGDDSKQILQWVELYNPTNNPVNIGGWKIGATTGLRNDYTIASGTVIQSQQFLVYTYGPSWFPHVSATVQLKTANGTVVDQTPSLTDQQNDNNSWQRAYDGYDTGSTTDWVFRPATPGSSNGKITTTTTSSQLTTSVVTDKTSYNFGETVTISGKVSQLVTVPNISYIPQKVSLIVSGPSGFQKTFTLFPGNNLQFQTNMKIEEVLGFQDGNYTISASYGVAKASTSFSVTPIPFTPPSQEAPITMSIATDKQSYAVGETIALNGNVSKIIPLTPVKYKVYDPDKNLIYEGTLFPDAQGRLSSTTNYQQHASISGIVIDTINTVYGVYNIVASYDTATATTSFTVSQQISQIAPISLITDKQAYATGDTVTITGRSNKAWVPSVNIEIIQSYTAGVVAQTFDIKTSLNVAGDSTFQYKFNIPGKTDRLGTYRVIVTAPYGSTESDFVVVKNPSSYQQITSVPLSLVTDKTSYAIGDPIIISGKVEPTRIVHGVSVQVSIRDSQGNQIFSMANAHANSGGQTSGGTYLSYYAYPDSGGNFVIKDSVAANVFKEGVYHLKATYIKLTTAASFSVSNPLGGTRGAITAKTDKQVYGVGETVNLTGSISSLTGTSSFTLTLTKPDGGVASTPLQINNGYFSWSWIISSTASTGNNAIFGTDRKSVVNVNPTANLYGLYNIVIKSDYGNAQLFFQVSQNPKLVTEISPILVQTDKAEYVTTDVAKISGQVIPIANSAAQETNSMVQIQIFNDAGQQALTTTASVSAGGQYQVSVPLHPGLWKTGTYKMYVQYLNFKTQTTFKVTDPFTTSSGGLTLFIAADHDKYLPGQTVIITGRTSFVVSVSSVDIFIGVANDTIISEGQIMSKKGNPLPHVTASFDQVGSFSYDYTIPPTTKVGNYIIMAQVPFGVFSTFFQVVNQLPVENIPTPTNATQNAQTNVTQTTQPTNATQILQPTIIPSSIGLTQKHSTPSIMIIEKTGKISDASVPITLSEKSVDNKTFYPRELDGLLRVNPGDENGVNIKVSSQDGVCIIGQDSDCKITASTIQGGSLYQTVKLGNENYLVGYSGPGMRLEQFSIVPVNSNDTIPDGQWNVEIIKKDQISRFYYQTSYISK